MARVRRGRVKWLLYLQVPHAHRSVSVNLYSNSHSLYTCSSSSRLLQQTPYLYVQPQQKNVTIYPHQQTLSLPTSSFPKKFEESFFFRPNTSKHKHPDTHIQNCPWDICHMVANLSFTCNARREYTVLSLRISQSSSVQPPILE